MATFVKHNNIIFLRLTCAVNNIVVVVLWGKPLFNMLSCPGLNEKIDTTLISVCYI